MVTPHEHHGSARGGGEQDETRNVAVDLTGREQGAEQPRNEEPAQQAGFYIAGMKSYGRAPTFLMLTGYEQVRSIIADIAGDKEAAERVELVLPETGVCSREPLSEVSGCCATPTTNETSACCSTTPAKKSTTCCG